MFILVGETLLTLLDEVLDFFDGVRSLETPVSKKDDMRLVPWGGFLRRLAFWVDGRCILDAFSMLALYMM